MKSKKNTQNDDEMKSKKLTSSESASKRAFAQEKAEKDEVSPCTPFKKNKEEKEGGEREKNAQARKILRKPQNLEQVKQEMMRQGISEELFTAEDFYSYYQARGWHTNGGSKIYNWMELLRSWRLKRNYTYDYRTGTYRSKLMKKKAMPVAPIPQRPREEQLAEFLDDVLPVPNAQKQPTTENDQPMTQNNQPTSQNVQPLTQNGQPLTQNGQQLIKSGPQLTAFGHSTTKNEHLKSENSKEFAENKNSSIDKNQVQADKVSSEYSRMLQRSFAFFSPQRMSKLTTESELHRILHNPLPTLEMGIHAIGQPMMERILVILIDDLARHFDTSIPAFPLAEMHKTARHILKHHPTLKVEEFMLALQNVKGTFLIRSGHLCRQDFNQLLDNFYIWRRNTAQYV